MGRRDPRVDAYIAKAAPFARPILAHLRAFVAETAPSLDETIKWGFPYWTGHTLVCSMAAFKAHCAFGFWRGPEVVGDAARDGAMGQLGSIASLADLPPARTMTRWLKLAVALDAQGPASVAKAAPVRAVPDVPSDVAAALKRNAAARKVFDAFPPSARRDYLEWIIEAKTDATRAKRLATMIEWVADGKRRNWKYEKC